MEAPDRSNATQVLNHSKLPWRLPADRSTAANPSSVVIRRLIRDSGTGPIVHPWRSPNVRRWRCTDARRSLYGGLTDPATGPLQNRYVIRSTSVEFFSANGREGGVGDVPGLRSGVETVLLRLRYGCIPTSFPNFEDDIISSRDHGSPPIRTGICLW